MHEASDGQSGSGAPDLSGVVVGHDGSATAEIALEWAGQAAQRHGLPLALLRARPDAEGEFVQLPLTPRPDERAAARIPAERPGLCVSAVVRAGSPVEAMLAASPTAQMLAIGSRGLEGLRGLLLGATTVQVARHVSCPGAAVHAPAPDA